MGADKKRSSLNLAVVSKKPKKLPSSDAKLGSFSQRLQLIAGEKKPRPFAVELGIPPSTFHQYFTGQSEPTRPVLSVIADKTGVNLQWLVDGTGPMMKDSNLPALNPADSSLSPTAQPFFITNLEGCQVQYAPSPELYHIPILSVRAACGTTSLVEGEYIQAIFSAVPAWFRRELNANPADLNIIVADGDSMADTIKPEEMVIVDKSKVHRQTDGIWVFRYEEGVFIKRLQFMPGRQIEITSDNPRYKTYTIVPDDSFRLLGRVIAALPLRKL